MFNFFTKHNNPRHKTVRSKRTASLVSGFSLFEMLTVIAIAMTITAITFSNFPKMNSRLSLELLTQDVALSIRQAQLYGTTVFGAISGDNTQQVGVNADAYGISFPKTGANYQYTLFADLKDGSPENKYRYDERGTPCGLDEDGRCRDSQIICGSPASVANGSNECLERFLVKGRDSITKICPDYYSSNAGETKAKRIDSCTDGDKCSVDIVYKRPKLQARITATCENQGTIDASTVGIVIESEGEETRVVVVWDNGQISVDR